nr:nucleotide-binding alpha-beta plait domain-containing protein [Tanacetum cinerariifolium]
MVLSSTYSTPPTSTPPTFAESIASIADILSKLVASQTAFNAQLKIIIERQQQTLSLILLIVQTNQRDSNTPTIAKPPTSTQPIITLPPNNHGMQIRPATPENPMAQVITVPSSSITKMEKEVTTQLQNSPSLLLAPPTNPTNKLPKVGQSSFVQQRETQDVTLEEESTSVLDESCLNQNDFSTCLMGKVKEFSSLTNLEVVLGNEGFDNIKLKYMGGYWVMIEFQSEELKDKFKENVSIRSWFYHIQQASSLFRNEEKVTWLFIEGVHLKFWTKETFNKIASKWGDLLYVDDENETCFHSKRICIKTKLGENIFESFKSVFEGKVFWVRAKEVSGWILDFVEEEDDDTDSEDEIRKDDLQAENDDHMNYEDDAADSNVEVVSEMIFEKDQSQVHNTDECEERYQNAEEGNKDTATRKSCPNDNSKENIAESICSGHFKTPELPRTGGFVLQVMEDLVKEQVRIIDEFYVFKYPKPRPEG